ncbi:MAG TPA: hypothetical protein VFJ02_06390 [Vicinamibacterales bacterium]|nr:hypothetical protein [Vicinamibacterales bacterium]
MTPPRPTAVLALVLALAPRFAAAQDAAPRIDQLVKRGEKVVVMDEDGQEIEGRIESISASTVALRVDGAPVDMPFDRIVRIDRPRDGLGNGALIGMGTTVSLSMIGLVAAQSSCEDRYYNCSSPPFWVVLWAAGSSAAIGAGIGVAIDALIHSERAIYRRGGGVRTTISPAIAHGVRGASVSVSW